MKVKCLIAVLGIALLNCSCSGLSTNEVQQKDKLSNMQYEVSDIAELGSVEYTIKQVISDKNSSSLGSKSILFGWMAYVKAGIDLNEFSEDDIEIDKKTQSVYVTLPHAKVLSVNIPPDSIKEIYHREGAFRGKFDPMERDRILDEGQSRLDEIIKTLTICSEAEANTKQLFEDLLAQMGYERQNIHIRFGTENGFIQEMTSKTTEL